MAIFSGPAWPHGVVPYRLAGAANSALVQGWVDRFNQRLGRTVLIPYLPFHPAAFGPSYLSIGYDPAIGESQAGDIGHRRDGEHTIQVCDEARFIHEFLHVLGFQHEQYHPKFGWISIPGMFVGDYNQVNAATQMVAAACTGNRDWNALLVSIFNLLGSPNAGATELMKWQYNPHPEWNIDDRARCDTWSAMMYPTCGRAVRRMRDWLLQPTTHQSWRTVRDTHGLLSFATAPNWVQPLSAPAPARYNLSARDKVAVCMRYGGHIVQGDIARNSWKELTSRNVLHHRSSALTELDSAIASCELSSIKRAFTSWYDENKEERTKRNHANCVELLRSRLAEFP